MIIPGKTRATPDVAAYPLRRNISGMSVRPDSDDTVALPAAILGHVGPLLAMPAVSGAKIEIVPFGIRLSTGVSK